MKTIKTMIAAEMVVVVAGGGLLAGCSAGEKAETLRGDKINKLEIKVEQLSTSKSYKVKVDGMDAYLTFHTSIDWPEEIGDYKLETLRDSLLYRMYRVESGTGVTGAIREFVNDRGVFGTPATFTDTDTVPNSPESYEITHTAVIKSVTPSLVTYQVYAESYLGGAHPLYSMTPFTYDLENGEIVTPSLLFKAGSDAAVAGLIREALARQEGVAVDSLARADIIIEQVAVSPILYIDGSSVVFHYNPYDIAPYSKGPIDVEVSSFMLKDYLTPRGAELLNE